MASAAQMIEVDFYSGSLSGPPDEIKHLIDLMRRYKPRNLSLIRNHASLENEARKSSLFITMYDHLENLKVLDNAKYQKVIGKIPYDGTWIHSAKLNLYLNDLLRYMPKNVQQQQIPNKKNKQRRKKKKLIVSPLVFRYKPNRKELLRFRRNGQGHLVKDCACVVFGNAQAAAAAAAVTGKPAAAAQQTQKLFDVLVTCLVSPSPSSWLNFKRPCMMLESFWCSIGTFLQGMLGYIDSLYFSILKGPTIVECCFFRAVPDYQFFDGYDENAGHIIIVAFPKFLVSSRRL